MERLIKNAWDIEEFAQQNQIERPEELSPVFEEQLAGIIRQSREDTMDHTED